MGGIGGKRGGSFFVAYCWKNEFSKKGGKTIGKSTEEKGGLDGGSIYK